MEENRIILYFNDDPETELRRLQDELGLIPLLDMLEASITNKQEIEEETKARIYIALDTVQKMFSVEVPQASDSPTTELNVIARGYHWSKLLREKALVALYRFVYLVKDESGLPFIATQTHPDTGVPFDETTFVHWFCQSAFINSSTAFQRLSTYKKLAQLGYDINKSFEIVISKPYLIRSALNSLAEFSPSGEVTKVNPEVAIEVSRKVDGKEIQGLVEANSSQHDLIEAFKPVMRQVIEQVAAHPNPKEASKFFEQDVLGKPSISYAIEEGGVLSVTMVSKIIEGDTYDETIIRIPFIPHTNEGVPLDVIEDLIKRLPIRNRREAEMMLDRIKHEQTNDIPF